MGSYINKNLSLIKKNNPNLFSKLNDKTVNGFINTVISKTGYAVPEVLINNRKLNVHSKFDPIKEANRFIAEIDPGKFDLFIVFGFGYAYHVEELFKKINKNAVILILEKYSAIIKAAIDVRDLSGLLSDERVNILVEPDEETIADILKGKSSFRVSFLTHRGSFQLDPEYYGNLRRITKSYLSTKEVNIATLTKFEKTWSLNTARNILEFINAPNINLFYGKFKNTPAIVAAAGPSLNKSMEFLHENKNKAVIIAVDTSYMVLKKNNIEPHFCLSVDPQVINARYFEGDTGGRTILIVDPTAHPSVFRLFKGKKASAGMAFDMMKWIEEITGVKGELAYGGSVSTNAYDFAKRIGASPVIMIGQDLAFTDGLAHASGSYLDEQIHLRTNRFNNANMHNRFQLTALPGIYVEGIRSNSIRTNQKLMIFLSWFEKRNDPELVNATYDGARIKGIKHVSAEELELNERKGNLFNDIEDIYNMGIQTNERNISIGSSLLKKCKKMRNELSNIVPVIERAVDLSSDLLLIINSGRKDQGKIDYIINKLNETDRMLDNIGSLKDMIGFTVQRVIHTITEGYEIDEEDKELSAEALVAKKSSYLYKGILEGARFNAKILKKMLAGLSNY